MKTKEEKQLLKKENKKAKNRRRGLSISWRLFAMLLCFVALILIVIWVFQVLLLNEFYQHSKMEEYEMTMDAIKRGMESEDGVDNEVYKCSYQFDMCISVYRMEETKEAKKISQSHINGTCILHHMSPEALSRLYNDAKENGGEYIERWKPHKETSKNRAISTVYVSVYEDNDGNEYTIMLNSDLEPLNATVLTLEKQFGWIACILVLFALILAAIISKTICAPLEIMSGSAKKLAMGDYSTDFGEGGGYKEARELADALNYASTELKKNGDLQKELVANISHDLRTPLTLIKGYAEVMADIPDENTPENLQIIADETERLTMLVNDMLDLSKIQSGTRHANMEIFNLTECVREVMQRYNKLTEKDGYSIEFEYTSEEYVLADKTMMLQVVYNLLNNAINYSGEDKTVKVIQSVSEGHVKISVSDTGQGIAPEDLPYIWDRYYKVDKVHRRAQVGTGLGLSIVKGILEQHNAYYGVESKLNVGSTFWFSLERKTKE